MAEKSEGPITYNFRAPTPRAPRPSSSDRRRRRAWSPLHEIRYPLCTASERTVTERLGERNARANRRSTNRLFRANRATSIL